MSSFDLVVACTLRGGIGLANDLPWSRLLKGDLTHFRKLVTGGAVVMGRKTWESIPRHLRPLQGRLNVIVTSTPVTVEGVLVASSLQHALSLIPTTRKTFVVGGASLIREALRSPSLCTIHLTHVLQDFECDTFIPSIANFPCFALSDIGPVHIENSIPYQFLTYTRRVNAEEQQYLDLVERVISSGHAKGDRTGTGTLSLFGSQMRFDLEMGFPLLTTKRVFWRGVVEELLWLIRGCTDSKSLAKKRIHIWDANGSRQFLDDIGLGDREEGDLGPVYGHQWRHFGARYISSATDYTGQGVDQLASIIHTLKTNPNDRRLVMSAWNPVDLPQMALPPCHVLCQFYVADGKLSCQMYQRSADLGLGVPFNIASYSLLTVMVAHVVGLKVGEFVHVLGDAHVYSTHVEGLKEQLKRTPKEFPKLVINREVSDIDGFTLEDFDLINYCPDEAIPLTVAV
jgi:dihydrofolate reductase/thymidylate synthase